MVYACYGFACQNQKIFHIHQQSKLQRKGNKNESYNRFQ